MSEEAAIEAAVEAWNTGVDEFVERLASDVEFHAPPGFPDGDVWRGRDAVAALLHEMFGSLFQDVKYKLEDATRGPDGWLLRARESVELERGTRLEWQDFTVLQFESGLVRRLWVFYELAAAKRQAGIDG